jgi:hypothetical protein
VRRLTLLLAVPVAVLATVLCGCGISLQQGPEAIAIRPSRVAVSTPPSVGPAIDTVFLVRGTRLQAVRRRTTRAGDVREVLGLLTGGPTPAEAAGGTRTALAPQPISVLGLSDSGVLTLGVTRQFTGVVGTDQLLAVAQVVWTVSQFPWVDGVRFVTGDEPLEIPTDHGLVQRTVTPADYSSVAPAASASPAPPT